MANGRLINSQSVKSIMSKRTLIPESAIGKRTVLTVQGNGNVIDVRNKAGEFISSVVDPNLVFQKKIFNCKAVSGIAMANPRNQQLLRDAIAAERSGDAEKASGLFNDFLNAVQLSFSIPLPSAKADKISDGVEIAGLIEKVTTENGSLLTVDASTISVVEPERYGSVNFNMDDFLPKEEKPETEETPAQTPADALKA